MFHSNDFYQKVFQNGPNERSIPQPKKRFGSNFDILSALSCVVSTPGEIESSTILSHAEVARRITFINSEIKSGRQHGFAKKIENVKYCKLSGVMNSKLCLLENQKSETVDLSTLFEGRTMSESEAMQKKAEDLKASRDKRCVVKCKIQTGFTKLSEHLKNKIRSMRLPEFKHVEARRVVQPPKLKKRKVRRRQEPSIPQLGQPFQKKFLSTTTRKIHSPRYQELYKSLLPKFQRNKENRCKEKQEGSISASETINNDFEMNDFVPESGKSRSEAGQSM